MTAPVQFLGSVKCDLPERMRKQLEAELPTVFAKLEPNRPPEQITVGRLFLGYTPDWDRKLVLGVEVSCQDGYDTHIVKIGSPKKVGADFDGWQACSRGQMISSRIFVPVRHVALRPDRVAVVYRDAYTLFGPDRQTGSQQSLEDALRWTVRDDSPDPLSAERTISHVYTDLGRWFFPGAQPDLAAARRFFEHLLGVGDADPAKRVFDLWQSNEQRQGLRRDAIWILAGRDAPDADPFDHPARYLDPLEYLNWAFHQPSAQPSRMPETLVGRSHGDLHGRNVLVGVRRGELEYPAVFDYGEMGVANVLAWDFAKLESELKVRLLPEICNDPAVKSELRRRSRLHLRCDADAAIPTDNPAVERAERMACFLAFEELLHEAALRIKTRTDAERIAPPPPSPPTPVAKLNRLLAVLLRVRKEAALWLGFERHKRLELWRNEINFALTVCGLLNVRWDYDEVQQEAAIVSAGVAAARMSAIPAVLNSAIEAWAAAPSLDVPSYRVPLAALHRQWTARAYDAGRTVVETLVLEVESNPTRFQARPAFRHAVPLIAEAALLEMECGFYAPAEELLIDYRTQAVAYGDFETLGRIGRLFKDAGDRKWDEFTGSFAEFARTAGWQMYRKALAVYEQSFAATGDCYTGINAATLALLTHDAEKAERIAARVADICGRQHDHDKQDRYWLFATEGEARVVLGGAELSKAKDYYASALQDLTPGQGGKASSSYKQLCRLWKALGDERVGCLLELFEKSEFRAALPRKFLGRSVAVC